MNKQQPKAPFYRKLKEFRPSSASVSFNDEPSREYQICHRTLLKSLMETFQDNEYSCNERICTYLFTVEQNFIVQRNYKRMNHEEFIDLLLRFDPLDKLFYHIKEALSLSNVMLPEYATTKSVPAGQLCLSEFSREELKRHSDIVKRLKKIVTTSLAQEYCDRFLCSHTGLGVGLHSREWHLSLAEWMDDIIASDKDVANFVKLSGDTPLDGTVATHDEMNKLLADNESDITIIPERNSPHLAQVQVTIQRLCIKSIAEKLSKDVLILYKRVFYHMD